VQKSRRDALALESQDIKLRFTTDIQNDETWLRLQAFEEKLAYRNAHPLKLEEKFHKLDELFKKDQAKREGTSMQHEQTSQAGPSSRGPKRRRIDSASQPAASSSGLSKVNSPRSNSVATVSSITGSRTSSPPPRSLRRQSTSTSHYPTPSESSAPSSSRGEGKGKGKRRASPSPPLPTPSRSPSVVRRSQQPPTSARPHKHPSHSR
jgi:hypothetical protein